MTLSIKPVEGVLVHVSEVVSGACWELLGLVAAQSGTLQGSACSMCRSCPGVPGQGVQSWAGHQTSSSLPAAVSRTAKNNVSALEPHQKKPALLRLVVGISLHVSLSCGDRRGDFDAGIQSLRKPEGFMAVLYFFYKTECPHPEPVSAGAQDSLLNKTG